MSTEVVRKRQACGLTQPLDMYVKRHEYFRWTPRTTWITLVYVAIVPSAFLYLAYRTEVSGDHTEDLEGATMQRKRPSDMERFSGTSEGTAKMPFLVTR